MKNIFLKPLFTTFLLSNLYAQNPTNLILSNPPPNLTINTYTRASASLQLLPGFKYGFTTGGASNLLNLSISSLPTFISSAYLGSSSNPNIITCGSVPTIDINKVVGQTNGSFQVSNTGAATYNIPIVVSPGTNGIQPNLAVNYNSQSGLGLVGTGWQLNGLSSISRITKTPMHDGTFGGINLNYSDVFAINGNRLFSLVGNYGQNNTTYYTENVDFSTITSFGTSGLGPEKFLVKDKFGNSLEFGYSLDSRLISGNGNTTILTWYLNKLTDEFGNYMLFNYQQSNGEIIIDHINYTGNTTAALAPYNSVWFEYIPIAELTTNYINGASFTQSQLLKSIVTKAGNAVVKKYTFDYEWDQGTYLSTVKEADSDGNELNPTKFCWRDPNDFSGTKNIQPVNNSFSTNDYANLTSVPADFNGDGFSDFLCFNTPLINTTNGRCRILRNDFLNNYGSANTSIPFTTIYDALQQTAIDQIPLSNVVTDEDNNNRQEVFSVFSSNYTTVVNSHQYNAPQRISNDIIILKTSDNNGTGLTVQNLGTYHSNTPFDIDMKPSPFMFNVGDHNGDGLNDILLTESHKLSLMIPNGPSYSYNFSSNPWFQVAKPFSFNADGITDYILFEDNHTSVNIKILQFNGNSINQVASTNIQFPGFNPIGFYGASTKNLIAHFACGDINGDGNDDLIYITHNLQELYFCKNTGGGFLTPVKINCFTPISGDFDLQIVDLNNDGKEDITLTSNLSQTNQNNYFTYFSCGDLILKGGTYQGNFNYGSIEKVRYVGSGTTKKTVTETSEISTGITITKADFNGDGIPDRISQDQLGNNQAITNNINGKIKQTLSEIYPPFKNILYIRYANINSGYFIQTNGAKEEILKPKSTVPFSLPLLNMKLNMYCVNYTSAYSGFSHQMNKITKYVYANPITHKTGRGFLGFTEISSFDQTTKIGSQTSMSVDPIYFIPFQNSILNAKFYSSPVPGLTSAICYSLDANHVLSKSEFTYALSPLYTSGFFSSLNSCLETDYLNSKKVQNSYLYNLNASGFVSNQTTTFGWNLQVPLKTTLITNSYSSFNAVFKIISQFKTETQINESPYSRDISYQYDTQGHLISSINDQNTTGLSTHILNTAFSQFNAFGLPTKFTISAPDITTRITELVYDATGRFQTKNINAIGNSIDATYEPVFGNIIETKESSGLVTKLKYNGLGKLTHKIDPNQAKTKIVYSWESPGNYPYSNSPIGIYSIKSEEEALPYVKYYYGSEGEELRKETQDFIGQQVISDIQYNCYNNAFWPDGVVLETTESHYPTQANYLKTKFTYDNTYIRPMATSIYSVSGNVEGSTGLYTQNTYNAPSTSQTYQQAFQQNIDQTGKSVKKLMNSAGQIAKISNNSTTQQQETNYLYHSNGQPKSISLTSTATPNQNIVHTFVYNGLGQNISTSDPSMGIINDQYNTLGELLQHSDGNGTFTYQYDVLGRVTSKNGSQSGTTNYQYIASGNGIELLEKITGPNSISEFKYDNFNCITESKETLSSNNMVLKSSSVYDTYHRQIEHQYAGGFKVKYAYSAMGFVTAIKDANNNSLWQLQNCDALGNNCEYDYGNGINTKLTYNYLHQISEINHGNNSIHKQLYAYNPLTLNLTSRNFKNLISNTDLYELFSYDNNDRLSQSVQYVPGNNTFANLNNVTYDVLGNITHKDDAGNLNYTNPGKPFTLTQITNATNNNSFNTLNVQHNDLNKIAQLSQMGTGKQLDVIYGNANQRLQSNYSINGNLQYTRYYAENYDREESANNIKEYTYIYAPSGLCAVHYNNNGNKQVLYALCDNLGSPVLLTNNNQSGVEEYAFDSWGRRRNPLNWSYANISAPQILKRGYTFHEELDDFNLINMNARLYDPVIGRMLEPDKFIQSPQNLQNFNRYAYAYNNPVSNTDPDGNFIATAATAYFLFGTESGYDLQKYVSPLAVKLDVPMGTHQRGIGVQASVGVPQMAAASGRVHGSIGYYWKNYDINPGWQSTTGFELGLGGVFTTGTTRYNNPGTEFDQTLWSARVGVPGLNIKYENDYAFGLPLADGGDRMRTAAAKIQVGFLHVGMNLFTGDPALFGEERTVDKTKGGKAGLYKKSEFTGSDPDKYRAGVGYINISGFRIGNDSEKRRNTIQNKIVHDKISHSPWFLELDRPNKFYFQFGTGGGFLW